MLVDRHDDFDAGLWFVAEHGGEIIGGILCKQGAPEDPSMGHVRDLAVIPAWRRRGVADALLQSAFTAFASRGLRRAGLDVDDVNLDGAVRLYERAGMAVARRIDIYEKELRPAR
ncbi:MAG: ribosomal protein S18 acetylase RimI-like enzyme [Glaciecola sp.]